MNKTIAKHDLITAENIMRYLEDRRDEFVESQIFVHVHSPHANSFETFATPAIQGLASSGRIEKRPTHKGGMAIERA